MEKVLAACFKTAVEGEQSRGSGGVVYLDGDKVAYLLLDQVQPEQLREKIADDIEEDKGQNYFILHRDAGNIHVSKLARRPLSE